MASGLFIGNGRARPRLFLWFLLLFLILGTCLASAVTGADYVRGSGMALIPDDRPGRSAAFSAQDDRCLLIAMVGEDAPQAFLLWRLRPAMSAMAVTAYAADATLTDASGDPVTLAALFGEGGRGGCEAVCGALTRARRGSPAHYLIVTDDTLRALMDRLGDTLTVTVPTGWEAIAGDYPGSPLTGGRQALTAGQLIALLSAPADVYPGGRTAYARMRGDVWASLCERFFTSARADELQTDYTVVANAAATDLGISHMVGYRDALTALAAQNAGRACTVSAPDDLS